MKCLAIPVLIVACFLCGTISHASAQTWQRIPMVTAQSRSAGVDGGEGGQMIRTLAMSPSNAKFLIMGTDVGGVYRSTDAGAHWQICMDGWNARGGNGFAIDPKNPDRILGVGANGNDLGSASMGVYLSTDRGISWKQTLPRSIYRCRNSWTNLTQPTGPHPVHWVRVHPKTRQAWVNGECYGMWNLDSLTKL